ncbi:MAG: hypothetical protein LYZ70_01055 [Nitrososphaerales archaeon]|nr:hypothetical protein [Nitrososphaerales archaeon]
MIGVVHASFSVGLLAGILLASAVVFGSIYASAQTQQAAGPLSTAAGQGKTTTAASTSSSTTAQVPAVAFSAIVSTTTSTNSSVGAGAHAGGGYNAYSLNSTASVLPSSRLGALSSEPGRVPILLLPLIAALLFGFALYKVSFRKD